MRTLVTGATGFAGRHLCRRLLEAGHEVVGTRLADGEQAPHPLATCDVRDAQAVDALLARTRPDAIVHLAAIARVQDAAEAPHLAFATNVRGTQNLLESAAAHAPRATLLVVSSAEVYGAVPAEALPIRESQPLAPARIYGLTKAAAECLCAAYADRLRAVVLRPFNHIGPGQSPRFVASSFARQVADIEARRAEPVLRVGNLEARRDFTDVRDVARAYALALDRCVPNTPYNVCSGRAVPVRRLLDLLLGMSDAAIRVEPDPARMRPGDVPALEGSPERFAAATGWAPRFDLERTLADLLAWWRSRRG
ncbi:MAG: GDP-mannose 4,6-dehydratase [Candidatus Brocadiia bacterium]